MENKNDNLYDSFLNYSYSQLKELFKNAKTKEEQDFYMTLSNLVLQKRVSKGNREIIWPHIQFLQESTVQVKLQCTNYINFN